MRSERIGGLVEQDGRILANTKEDLTERVFGKLTVLRRAPDGISSGRRRPAWWCKCSCGNPNELWILGDSLKRGCTKSCGCAVKESQIDNNKYDLNGAYGICTMKNGKQFIFDVEDYDKIKKYRWHLNGSGYVETAIYEYVDGIKKEKFFNLSRYLMGIADDDWKKVMIDHKNGDILDNRKENLRLVTPSQNGYNKKCPVNKSGVVGVFFHKQSQKWEAHIGYENNSKTIGRFENFEDAVKARKEAEEKYFGEYSYDNSRGIKRQEEMQNDI